MILAIVADVLQIAIFPVFAEGAMSPAEDVLDFGVGALMVHLLGCHWEFLPSFFAKLMPGVDLILFWTLAVVNVYRKSKRMAVEAEQSRQSRPELERIGFRVPRFGFRGCAAGLNSAREITYLKAPHLFLTFIGAAEAVPFPTTSRSLPKL